MNKNKKECIDDLNYIKKALTEGTLTRDDLPSILLIIFFCLFSNISLL